jgi:hypothetical protein
MVQKNTRQLIESANLTDIPAAEQKIKSESAKLGNAMTGTKSQPDAHVIAYKKNQCELSGGTWDSINNKCIPAPKEKPVSPGGFYPNENPFATDNFSGIQIIEGKNGTIYSIPIKKSEAGIMQKTNTVQEQALANRRTASQEQNNQLINSITGEPNLTEQDLLNAVPQEPGLENLQAGLAGAGGGLAGALGGAGIGAGIGALGGPAAPISVPAFAIGGAIVGLIGGAYTKISLDKRGDVTQAKKVAGIAYKNLGQTTDALNSGLITRDVAVKRWNEDRITLYAARANLQRETQKDLNRFLSGGADELAMLQDYINDLETFKKQEFLMALENPNAANVKYIYQPGVADE